MILSDRDIKERLRNGDLSVEPLDDPELQIQPASIDLRLGREFLEFQRSNIPCIHPDSQEETQEYTREKVVEAGSEYVLHPGDFVLGSTYETVEIPNDLVANVEGRSSLGRLAIVVHASLPYEEEVFLWTPGDGYGFHEIGEVVEEERQARAVSFDPRTLRVSTHEVTDYVTNPVKDIYRVVLESGREVLVTRDHNLFSLDEHGGVTRVQTQDAEGCLVMVPHELPEPLTQDESIDLGEMFLDEDDVMAYVTDGDGGFRRNDSVPDGSVRYYEERGSAPMSAVRAAERGRVSEVAFKGSSYRVPSTVEVTPEFGWVLGFYVAEGYAKRKQIVFTNNDDNLLERVADWFSIYDASLSWNRVEQGASKLTVCSALWSRIFRELAGSGRDKNVPERAWNWSDRVLEGILNGLVDEDGCRRKTRDTFYTANEDLADSVMYICARLGLLNSAYSRDRETSTEWSVDISEDAHKRGQYVPAVPKLLRATRGRSGMTLSEAADRAGFSSKSSISNLENAAYESVKRSSLKRLRYTYSNTAADTTRLDQLLDGDVRFERVKRVEPTGRNEVTYDLEVQPHGRSIENFIAGRGGIFLSNTAGFVDPGYRGQITLELSNLGTAPVALRPREMRVSQIVLTELSSPAERPYGSDRGSKYQDQRGPTASRIQDDEEWK